MQCLMQESTTYNKILQQPAHFKFYCSCRSNLATLQPLMTIIGIQVSRHHTQNAAFSWQQREHSKMHGAWILQRLTNKLMSCWVSSRLQQCLDSVFEHLQQLWLCCVLKVPTVTEPAARATHIAAEQAVVWQQQQASHQYDGCVGDQGFVTVHRNDNCDDLPPLRQECAAG